MAELDDDREGIEPEALDEDAGDPAAAFDALRRTIETQGAQIGAEMTVMRRGLEAAFDQLEKIEPAMDVADRIEPHAGGRARRRCGRLIAEERRQHRHVPHPS